MAVQRESVATPIMQIETLATLTCEKEGDPMAAYNKPGGNKNKSVSIAHSDSVPKPEKDTKGR
jgi:hypothetical protein